MGDSVQEKKSFSDILDETIKTIEKRQEYLKTKLIYETDDKFREEINEELTTLDQQMSFTVDAKKNVDREMQKAKDDKQKKYIENMLKASYFIGMMRENIRLNMERDRKFDKEFEEFTEVQFERAVEKVFDSMDLRHVTKDMVDQIMNDVEFDDMEQTQDVHRLDRKADDMKEKYEAAIDKILGLEGKNDANLDFAGKQRRLSVVVNKSNGFQQVAKDMRTMMNSEYYKKFATAEEREFFEGIYKDIYEIGNETARLYKDFESSESDFEKGNGFTRVLINKEQEMTNKIQDFTQKKILPRVLEMANKGDKDAEDVYKLYAASLKFVHPMAFQSGLDKVLCENNELRTRMEMWKVRERLPKGGSLTKRQKQKAVDDEYKCWAKVERMKRSGAELGGTDKSVSEWGAEAALEAFKVAKNARDSERDRNIAKADKIVITPKQREAIKIQLASLVLKHLIDIERKKPLTRYRGHLTELIDYKKQNKDDTYENALKGKFKEMSEKLAKDPDFLKEYEKMNKSKDYASKVINFIAEDLDKKLATDLDKKFSMNFDKEQAEKEKEAAKASKAASKKAKNVEPEKKEAPVLKPNIIN